MSFSDERKTGKDKGLVSSKQADELRNKTLAKGRTTLGASLSRVHTLSRKPRNGTATSVWMFTHS